MDKVSPQIHAQISDNPNDSIKQNKSNKSSCFRRTTNNPSENGAVDEEIKKKKRNKVKFPKSGDPIFTNPEIFMTPVCKLQKGFLGTLILISLIFSLTGRNPTKSRLSVGIT